MTLQETQSPAGHRFFVNGRRVSSRAFRALERAMEQPSIRAAAVRVSH